MVKIMEKEIERYCLRCNKWKIHKWHFDEENNFKKLKCTKCGRIADIKNIVDKYAGNSPNERTKYGKNRSGRRK